MTPGAAIAHYRITSKLGEGGMGAVYRATDTKLNRDVAIKILPDALADDPDYLARFTREAQVLAALNHPHIAAVYGVEDRAIVMELVEGRDLPTGLPLDEALPIARQIAEALEAAHDKGIVHRDLKPANIKLTADGKVKVLDFGLATAPEATQPTTANSPTLTLRATQAGVIMGTAAYMAPEQAAGKPVDKRADIWAFGAVLYELLTGQQLFTGDSVIHILALVVKDPIDLSPVPEAVRPLLARCLDRDPRSRLRDIGEARITLSNPLQAAPKPAVPVRRPSVTPWIVAAVLAASGAAGWWKASRPAAPLVPVRFQLGVLDKATRPIFELSPDGRYLAYTATIDGKQALWVRPLDSLDARLLPGTEDATYLAWSPDSTALAFMASGKVKKTARDGGLVQTLCDAPAGRGIAWGPNGNIVFSATNDSALSLVSASGGASRLIGHAIHPGEEHERYPEFIAGSDRFLYLRSATKPEVAGVYLGSVSGAAPIRILPDLTQAYFTRDPATGAGWIVFARDASVVAQPFDPQSGRLSGEPVLLGTNVGLAGNTSRWGFTSSASGALAFRALGLGSSQLAWADRAGRILSRVTQPAEIAGFGLSPDEKRLLMRIRASNQTGDFWMQDLERGTLTRFTSGQAADTLPIWSPDGRDVIWTERPNTLRSRILRKPADGSAREDVLAELGHQTFPLDWSSDGKYFIVGNASQLSPSLLLFSATDAARPLQPIAGRALTAVSARFSPDARWLAVSLPDSGGPHVWVQAFPDAGPRWQVYPGAADNPVWSRDGRELFILGADRKLIAIPVETQGSVFKAGTPQALFEYAPPSFVARFQPSRDGRRFLIVVAPEGVVAPPLDMILNWPATVKK